jgi:hypothetical protein
MTTTHGQNPAAAVPQFALAGAFLEGLAGQDFAKLGGALAPGARLRALLPPGLMERTGAEEIAEVFARWFGGTEVFDPVEATVGEGWFTVEQQAYADTDAGGRIARLDLLCTGYRPDGDND